MPALHRLRVKNFRNLRDVDLELGDLNVLVGSNGAGKSNLLSVLEFLGDSIRRDLVEAVARAGGFERLRFRGASSGEIEIGINAEVTTYASRKAQDEYVLKFLPAGRLKTGLPGRMDAARSRRALWREESFKFKRTRGAGRRLTVEGGKLTVMDEGRPTKESELDQQTLGLSTLPKLGAQQGARQVAQIAELFSTFRVFEVDVQAARAPSPVEWSDKLEADAANIAAFLAYLSDDHEEVFEALLNDLRLIVPGFRDMHFVPVGGAGRGVAIELEEEHFETRTLMGEASFGTIRAIALLAMLHDPHPPKMTCVEEIDHGLHPYALDVIVERLRSASRRTQLLVATHSPTLVNRLKPNELIVCQRDPETGEALIPAIDPKVVAEMERKLDGQVRLGELWFTGALGGVPE